LTQNWTIRDVDETVSQALADSCALSPLLARTLVARGIRTADAAELFLHPDLDRDWSDPALIPGMMAVADALEEAIRARKRILVFGDFDVDGISATACMFRGLTALGATVSCLIPNRMDEGYGLTTGVLERIYEKEPELLITVDCGISSRDEVAQLLARGIQVLITDHHEPSDAVPLDVPVTDPKLAKDSPQATLAGVGVALKLIALLGERFGQPRLWRDLVDLATLGTLADIMPLTGENRSLVAEGLTLLEQSPRPGIAAVLALAQRGDQVVSASNLSFSLIPRLNAAGRVGDPLTALDLLISDDPLGSFEVATALEDMNSERRSIEGLLLTEALTQAKSVYHGQKILIVAGEGWHEGVRGIVASRLVSRYGVPVIVFTLVDGEARGSGRSVGAVNLFKAVDRCADLTLRFGGHEAAVGLTVFEDRLDELRARMEAVMEEEPQENFHPAVLADALLELADLKVEAVDQLSLLEPYGHHNREPLFATRGVVLQNVRAVGAKKDHLSFSVRNGQRSIQAIWFQCPAIDEFVTWDGAVDIIYRLQVEEWNGVRRVKLMIAHAWRAQGDEDFVDDLVTKIIGTPVQLHPAQRAALDALGEKTSLLAIMATGRGKSLIFQAHAARMALSAKQASVFIYPLRALIADQAAHLAESFARLGLCARSLTGENTTAEKDRIFEELYSGAADVVLTTPEFFGLHAWRFAESARVGFIVFDEAHHIQTEHASDREGYRDLRRLREQFPQAQYLAVTATADDRITKGICQTLGIERVIVDAARRDNLRIDDVRGLCDRDRERSLVSIVEQGEKTVIYANSRVQATTLARLLRKQNPACGESIVFYHAGLARGERQSIEEGFRSGKLRVIISTSAFGEGVNIPDISHVVLYHLPFSAVAFNQMSGRAGRDGQPATIHLLYAEADAELNRRLLVASAPPREDLATLYREMRDRCRVNAAGVCTLMASPEQLVAGCRQRDPQCGLDERGAASGLAIFEELGLLRLLGLDEGYPKETIELISSRKVELSASSRYLEGREELALFERFREWAFEATADELREQLIGPLTPSFDGQVSEHE
jgi:single-stranded-DNA-specific exonuclease